MSLTQRVPTAPHHSGLIALALLACGGIALGADDEAIVATGLLSVLIGLVLGIWWIGTRADSKATAMLQVPSRDVTRAQRRRGTLRTMLDLPRFVIESAAAWYLTLIGVLGITSLVMAVVALVTYWIGSW